MGQGVFGRLCDLAEPQFCYHKMVLVPGRLHAVSGRSDMTDRVLHTVLGAQRVLRRSRMPSDPPTSPSLGPLFCPWGSGLSLPYG